MEITFSIIGTAGRDDTEKLSEKHFRAMCIVADNLIDQFAENNYPITHLVSGGAAWADHVAVVLFLDKKVKNLRLYLPCEFENGAYKDTGEKDFKKNPGGTANHYHTKFKQKTGIHSLSQIQIAIREGAEARVPGGGFHGRNSLVAKSDFLLACTYGEGNVVKDGGTADTVRKYLERVEKNGFFNKSFHYNLSDGKVYEGVEAPPKDEKKLVTASAQYFKQRVQNTTQGIVFTSPKGVPKISIG